MTSRFFVLVLAALAIPSCPALADDTGFAAMHDLSRSGGRTCFLDHYHYGSSAAQPTRKAAEKAALVAWSSFVDLEYGSDWAKAARAASRSIICDSGASGWGCSVEARPCR